MSGAGPVIIEVALNGTRMPVEHPAVPLTPDATVADAARCFEAGAAAAHFHARTEDGAASFDPDWYAAAIAGIRSVAPGMLTSITSLRPEGTGVEVMVRMLEALAERNALPDLMSVNLGHTVRWERATKATTHFPNDYADVLALLEACGRLGVVPELGLMDLGYLSNATLLHRDGELPAQPWFLVELDSPGYGLDIQVAPATARNYDHLSGELSEQVPGARWVAHGQGVATYRIVERALETGAHVRVGLEDVVSVSDGSAGDGNLDQVRWTVEAARRLGRTPATPAETRAIIGIG